MQKNRVTIGLPFYNNAGTLKDAVRSIFAQTWANWELIMTDDGSSDDSLNIVRKITDPRVKIIADGQNRGLVYRLNQITKEAAGEFLARMDGDDLIHPDRLLRQITFLENNPNHDLVSTGICSIDRENRARGVRALAPMNQSAEAILTHGEIIHASVVGKREWFKNNPYDPAFPRAEDRELWIRTFFSSRFGKVCEPLYFVREIDSFSLFKYLQSYTTERKILRKYGRHVLGFQKTAFLCARSWIKSILISSLDRLGQANAMMKGRIVPLREDQRQDFERAMAIIRSTIVPGLDI